MDDNLIRQACYELLAQTKGEKTLSFAEVDDATEIYGAGFDLDSLELTGLIVNIEKRFGIEVRDDEYFEADTFENFGALCRFVSKKVTR